jgi:hypothetical protein
MNKQVSLVIFSSGINIQFNGWKDEKSIQLIEKDYYFKPFGKVVDYVNHYSNEKISHFPHFIPNGNGGFKLNVRKDILIVLNEHTLGYFNPRYDYQGEHFQGMGVLIASGLKNSPYKNHGSVSLGGNRIRMATMDDIFEYKLYFDEKSTEYYIYNPKI